jgi:hypothetical protein
MLDKNEKAYRRETWVTGAIFVFALCLVTIPLWLDRFRLDTPTGISYAFSAFIFFLYAIAEVLKHFINRSRVEILREVKQVQLQVLELQASIRKSGDQ